jgi:hypothetical protein
MPNAKLELVYDEEAPDPRKGKHLGTIIAWHEEFNYSDPEAPQGMTRSAFLAWAHERQAIIVPVFELDGRLLVNDGKMPPDAAFVGYIYSTPERYGNHKTLASQDGPVSVLAAEVRAFDRWVNDERYGFRLRTPEGSPVTTTYGFDDPQVALAAGYKEAKDMGLDVVSVAYKIVAA